MPAFSEDEFKADAHKIYQLIASDGSIAAGKIKKIMLGISRDGLSFLEDKTNFNEAMIIMNCHNLEFPSSLRSIGVHKIIEEFGSKYARPVALKILGMDKVSQVDTLMKETNRIIEQDRNWLNHN